MAEVNGSVITAVLTADTYVELAANLFFVYIINSPRITPRAVEYSLSYTVNFLRI